jgi:adenylosuccinate lyase
MPTSLIDSVVFRDIFGTEPMRSVWSDGNRTHRYFDIEAALARAEAMHAQAARGSLQRRPGRRWEKEDAGAALN